MLTLGAQDNKMLHYASNALSKYSSVNMTKTLLALPETSKTVTMSMVCTKVHSTTFDKTCRVKDHLQTVKLGCPTRIIS